MKIKITNPFDDEQQALACPVCGDFHTHVTGVKVFACREDADAGTHVEVSGVDCYQGVKTKVLVDSDMSGNTSHRRGSVHLVFYCEICTNETTIAFSQHKGNTLMHVSDCHQMDLWGER